MSTMATHRTIPHVRGVPVLGSTLGLVADAEGWVDRAVAQHGEVFSFHAVGRRWVMVNGPESVGAALENRDRALASGPAWELMIGPFFKRGIIMLDFDEHLGHRRIMQSAFTRDRLESYLQSMSPVIAEGLATWPEHVRAEDRVRQLTLDIATRTFMGAEVGAEADRLNHAFHDAVKAGTSIVRHDIPGLGWSRGLIGRQVLEGHLFPQVPAKMASDEGDLFSALCHARSDDGDAFTADDVVNHMIFLLMAAHDTSTSAMSTMLYHLAKNPDWQERCRAESVALGRAELSYDDLAALPSLDLVFKEALRLVSPVPVLGRSTVKDTVLADFAIPADTFVAVNLSRLHRDPDVWPDPLAFDPGRFADERREDKVHRHAFEPFGGGVHKCIGMFFAGMQVKAILHQVLLTYRFACPDGYTMHTNWRGLPTPSEGVPLVLERC